MAESVQGHMHPVLFDRRILRMRRARVAPALSGVDFLIREAAVDLERQPSVAAAGEPGSVCPACQHGRMQLVQTLYRQPAAWDLSVPTPGLDTS